MDYDDLDAYNGDTEHDMWVNYDYHENTGELADIFDEDDEASGDYIDWLFGTAN